MKKQFAELQKQVNMLIISLANMKRSESIKSNG